MTSLPPARSSAHDHARSARVAASGPRRRRVAAWIVLLGYAVFQAWAHRYAVGPDGISYLDLSDAVVSGHWSRLINLYWSPLYPALIGVARAITAAGPASEVPLVHAVNVGCFIVLLAAFEYFLIAVRALGGETRDRLIAGARGDWIAYGAFAFLVFTGDPLELTTPDLLANAATLVALGCLLRLALPDARRVRHGVILGAALGIGALAKAFLVPWAVVSFAIFAIRLGRRSLAPLMAGVGVWAIVVGSWSAVLSRTAGRLTLGDAGRLTYAWYVNLQDPPSANLVPPDARNAALDRADVFAGITGPAPGTDPMWFDPARWNASLRPRADVRQQIRAVLSSGVFYIQTFALLLFVIPWLVVTPLAALHRAWTSGMPVYLAAAAGLFGYAAVLVATRYVVAYVVATLVLLGATLPVPRRLHPLYATFGVVLSIGMQTVSERDAAGLALTTAAIATVVVAVLMTRLHRLPWLGAVLLTEALISQLLPARQLAVIHIAAGAMVVSFWIVARRAVQSGRTIRFARTTELGLALAIAGIIGVQFAARIRHDVSAARLSVAPTVGNISFEIAQDVRQHGLRPGTAIAIIGPYANSPWARAARLHIVAAVPGPMVHRFWALPDAVRRGILARFAHAGAAYAVAVQPPSVRPLGRSWIRLRYQGWLLSLDSTSASR